MTCHKAQGSLSAFSDGRLPERERNEVSSHLANCRECSIRAEQQAHLIQALRALPPLAPPARLSTCLRVLASRELSRQRIREAAGAVSIEWLSHVKRWLEDMMQPVALPLAGGLISAIFLFAMLVPTFFVPSTSAADDVPTALYTEATVREMGPFELSEDEIVLDLMVNQQGRVVDYSSPGAAAKDPQTRRKIENMLVLTVFNPMTTFGQPLSGKVRITLRRSAINVIG